MKKVITFFPLMILLIISQMSFAQNTFPSTGSAGIGTTAPNTSSLLEIKSTTKGLLIPRMTQAQRDLIASPANALLIYQTNASPGFYYYNGSDWKPFKYSAGTGISISNSIVTNTAPDKTVVLNSGTGINITGSYPNFTINSTAAGSQWTVSGSNIIYSAGDAIINGVTFGKGGGNISSNTAVGISALSSNTTGNNNSANGYKALYSNTTGNYNSATGEIALYSNTTGTGNTANGQGSLYYNTTGGNNSGVGQGALYSNTTGTNNTGMGIAALNNNTAGSFNTAFGINALHNNTTSYATAVGANALAANTTGLYNTAVGSGSLQYNTTGSNNLAYGYIAGYNNSTGSNNIFMGYSAGSGSQTGSNNICIGSSATIGNGISNSIVLGNSLSTNYSNAVILGNSSQNVGIGTTTPYSSTELSVNGGTRDYTIYAENHNTTDGVAVEATSDQLGGIGVDGSSAGGAGYGVFGNSTGATSTNENFGIFGTASGSTAQFADPNFHDFFSGNIGIEGYGASGSLAAYFSGDVDVSGNLWSGSDQKLKKNIKPINSVLATLAQIKTNEYDFDQVKSKDMQLNLPTKHQFGFIAQDVLKYYPNLVAGITSPLFKDVNGKRVSNGITGYLAVNYMGFIPLLTKAVQELSVKNDSLEQNNASLQYQIDELKVMIQTLASKSGINLLSEKVLLSSASLEQNAPNPFKGATTIGYTLPQNYSSSQIIIRDNRGVVLKAISISGNGKGSLNVDASTVSSGAYNYSLVVDGRMIDTKQMIIVK